MQSYSLPNADPRCDRPQCRGRKSRFLAVILAGIVAGLCSCTPSSKEDDELYTRAEKGDAAALKKLRFFADRDSTRAQVALGNLYRFGAVVPKDEAEAVKWFQKANDRGEADLQCLLGDYYILGTSAPKDEVEAARCYEKAAVQGHAYSQLNLGELYAKGSGVPANVTIAYKWALLSAAQGIGKMHVKIQEQVDDLIHGLEARLTPDQRTEGQRMAREFKPAKGKK